ncbi:hypothetical protein [Rhodococcus sp. W8901]|uniref:hypothetical protein n=1 Tax=Rhodococcus sp. W8901 TaxID=2742603 RepID=UPI001582DB0D|nr:hypothetical protein [Rhodococcus sp. W8901]QKT13254.1 hypothetical protein HUN07_23230 [Rhodococcus sp. W8901]
MTDLISSGITALRAVGWAWEPAGDRQVVFPGSRYEVVPPQFSAWSSAFGRLSNADETVWFLSAGDYSAVGEDAFAWNEFEIMSLDAAETDEQASAVVRFWDRHLPILLSVKDGYSYVALGTSGEGAGRVILGEEPEFEESVPLADDFDEFLAIIAGRRDPADPRPWNFLFDK